MNGDTFSTLGIDRSYDVTTLSWQCSTYNIQLSSSVLLVSLSDVTLAPKDPGLQYGDSYQAPGPMLVPAYELPHVRHHSCQTRPHVHSD